MVCEQPFQYTAACHSFAEGATAIGILPFLWYKAWRAFRTGNVAFGLLGLLASTQPIHATIIHCGSAGEREELAYVDLCSEIYVTGVILPLLFWSTQRGRSVSVPWRQAVLYLSFLVIGSFYVGGLEDLLYLIFQHAPSLSLLLHPSLNWNPILVVGCVTNSALHSSQTFLCDEVRDGQWYGQFWKNPHVLAHLCEFMIIEGLFREVERGPLKRQQGQTL